MVRGPWSNFDEISSSLEGLTEGDAEASHDLVEDEKGAVLVAQGAESLEELEPGNNEAGVADHGFKNNGSDFALEVRPESHRHAVNGPLTSGKRDSWQASASGRVSPGKLCGVGGVCVGQPCSSRAAPPRSSGRCTAQ